MEGVEGRATETKDFTTLVSASSNTQSTSSTFASIVQPIQRNSFQGESLSRNSLSGSMAASKPMQVGGFANFSSQQPQFGQSFNSSLSSTSRPSSSQYGQFGSSFTSGLQPSIPASNNTPNLNGGWDNNDWGFGSSSSGSMLSPQRSSINQTNKQNGKANAAWKEFDSLL